MLTASEGTYEAGSEGVGTLTLEGVERATWFSDRPAREVGVYDIAEMNEVFFTDQVPPNAALEMIEGPDDTQDVVILELSSPVWDAASGTLAYDAIVLEPGTLARDGSALATHHDRADAAVPTAFGTAVLFIDSAARPPACLFALNGSAGHSYRRYAFMGGVTCKQAKEIILAATFPPTKCDTLPRPIYIDTPYGPWDRDIIGGDTGIFYSKDASQTFGFGVTG